MTAGRKSHDPHLRRVDSPGVGIFPNHPDGTLCIFQGCQGVGYSGLFTRKPVLEKKGGNALPGKPLCHLAPFPFHEQGVITTTGADDHGTFQLDPLLGDKEGEGGIGHLAHQQSEEGVVAMNLLHLLLYWRKER
jgi:hypothetical protein